MPFTYSLLFYNILRMFLYTSLLNNCELLYLKKEDPSYILNEESIQGEYLREEWSAIVASPALPHHIETSSIQFRVHPAFVVFF